jgi:diguanylate cyclase (GGDEF)-like protein
MIDADHFKAYNDTYGHQAGDQVLVGIAICISDSVRRSGDCPARYGGEEFAVLLPGLSAVEAFTVAENHPPEGRTWAEDPSVTTVSIGVASMTPTAPSSWPDLIEAADKALYAAKANGRNQSVVAVIRSLRWWLRRSAPHDRHCERSEAIHALNVCGAMDCFDRHRSSQ